MGPVGLPDRQEAVAKELWAALASRDDWRDADLRGLPEDRPWLGLLAGAAAAGAEGGGHRRPERGGALPRAARHVGGLPRGAAGEAPPRDQAQGEEARGRGRPVPDRDGDPGEPARAARPVRGAPPHERGTEGRLHAAGDGDLLPAARRGVLPGGHLPAHVHRGRRAARGRHDRVRVRRDLVAVQLRLRPRVGRARARHGAGRRGHPARDRGRVRRLRPAEGRLSVQVPVRRRAAGREAARGRAARPA